MLFNDGNKILFFVCFYPFEPVNDVSDGFRVNTLPIYGIARNILLNLPAISCFICELFNLTPDKTMMRTITVVTYKYCLGIYLKQLIFTNPAISSATSKTYRVCMRKHSLISATSQQIHVNRRVSDNGYIHSGAMF